ncbi:MAG: hypothetical protein O2943_03775 [Actinomycetota bacterium]|nr:hypothetical protein [Actinomycetota bacterium]
MTVHLNIHHLNNHHRGTLAAIFAHPTSHNIRWVDVISLLEALGSVEVKHDGRLRITVGPEIEVFDRSHNKDISIEQVTDFRRMLKHAGYGPTPPDTVKIAVEKDYLGTEPDLNLGDSRRGE